MATQIICPLSKLDLGGVGVGLSSFISAAGQLGSIFSHSVSVKNVMVL